VHAFNQRSFDGILALILSPGPVAIREGLPALAGMIARWAGSEPAAPT